MCKNSGCGEAFRTAAVYLIGWRSYFGFCQTPSVLRGLDQWIRRRLRAVVWKQWKRGRTRFAELRRRGVGPALAAKTAGKSVGPLAAREQSGACYRSVKRLLRVDRLSLSRGPATCMICRTAGYGPVCPVVWEGRSRERPPYPDSHAERNRTKGTGEPGVAEDGRGDTGSWQPPRPGFVLTTDSAVRRCP